MYLQGENVPVGLLIVRIGKTSINPCLVIMSVGTKMYLQRENVPQPKTNITVNALTDSSSDHVWCVEGLQIESLT